MSSFCSACEQGPPEEEQIDLGASDVGCKIPMSADAYLVFFLIWRGSIDCCQILSKKDSCYIYNYISYIFYICIYIHIHIHTHMII